LRPGTTLEGSYVMTLAAALNLFDRVGGEFVARWLHVIVGITWIGLLYYFNFVQVPAFAQMEAAARNNAIDKLASRALWWFRWAALATAVSGLCILAFQPKVLDGGGSRLFDGDYWKTTPGMSIATGILLALTMLVNVWAIIWRNQKVVIANARNVQAGGEADPNAAAAGRKAGLASRQNTIFSFAMLMFMIGTSHLFGRNGFDYQPGGGSRAGYWLVILVVWAAMELSALGVIGGTGQNVTNWMYEKHSNALIAGGALVVVYYLAFYLFLKS
jgi:uncharacterized membrane protein